MQTIMNYLESAVIAVCLILIGVGALWAWGAWKKVEAPAVVQHYQAEEWVPIDIPNEPCEIGAELKASVIGGGYDYRCTKARAWVPEAKVKSERDATGEAWKPVSATSIQSYSLPGRKPTRDIRDAEEVFAALKARVDALEKLLSRAEERGEALQAMVAQQNKLLAGRGNDNRH